RIARRKTECAVGSSHGARLDARGAFGGPSRRSAGGYGTERGAGRGEFAAAASRRCGLRHILRSADRRETREQRADQRAIRHAERQEKDGRTGIRTGNWVYSVCGNRLRGVQNGDERRFLAGARRGGQKTGPGPRTGRRRSAVKAASDKNLAVRAAALEARQFECCETLDPFRQTNGR